MTTNHKSPFFSSNRRDFLKKSSLGLGAAFLGPSLMAFDDGGPFPEDKKLGVALVGLGYYATHKLAVGLAETKYCKLTGLVTGSPDKLPDFKEKYGIQDKNVYNYENYDQIKDKVDDIADDITDTEDNTTASDIATFVFAFAFVLEVLA